MFNEKDTLIDELKNAWESFSFTYKNNDPLIFGIYHLKERKNKHNFLVLFENNEGIKYTSKSFDYQEVRKIYNTKNTTNKNYEKFNFTVSKEYIWLTFENGTYKKLAFFNHNKAIREQTKEQTLNYYLIE